MTLCDRPVILLGDGTAAAAKRRLLERAGARIVGEAAEAPLAIVAIEEEDAAKAAVARLRARGILINAVDRPALCDFTLPAIVDRDPVLIAIGTGGASAGLAKALRQRIEAMLPAGLGRLAAALHAARAAIRARWPEPDARRRAIDAALDPGGLLDPLTEHGTEDVAGWIASGSCGAAQERALIRIRSADPDDLTLRDARLLGRADRLYHRADVPGTILSRARADAERITGEMPSCDPGPGLTLDIAWDRAWDRT
ncbi:precorrin-2 dehydrogenase/sirohydrochlorin ferrochelatase family protein [Sphingomonas oleivorans]|uniref:precorrin-2 dehydrogenase/sirohydrochlorin ferrochelatase family protein n=1 Tax=Sphingomonas oleivorans TaxID=1735121 RepID=UPI001FAE7AD4|nr:NAD(P)-dependent oxidoreductase [Sphingomonas oleivorans]